jgi:hypothetical protein
MHLQVAERIRVHDRLHPRIKDLLDEAMPAFYLGNVAADFQTIADVPREATHFYKLPPARDTVAHERMLQDNPQLADPAALSLDHAVFIAAYRAHLLLDQLWYWDVLIPYFMEATDWDADHRQRFLVHNTLLTFLDKQAFEGLPPGAGETLGAAVPRRWLPFAGDGDLIRWRDLLVDQMRPGATIQTITIYAERMRLSPTAFAANLADMRWMQQQVFSKAPLDEIQAVMTRGVELSVDLIGDYLCQKSDRSKNANLLKTS